MSTPLKVFVGSTVSAPGKLFVSHRMFAVLLLAGVPATYEILILVSWPFATNLLTLSGSAGATDELVAVMPTVLSMLELLPP